MAEKKEAQRDRYMTPAEVAETLSCTEQHVYNLIAQGFLLAIKIGSRALRISEQALREFIENNRFNPEDLYDLDREEQADEKPKRPPAKSMWMTK